MMKSILKVLNIIIILLGLFSIYLYISNSEILKVLFSYYTMENTLIVTNEYGTNTEYNYFQKTTNFTPKSRTDLLNIYYTVISSNTSPFTFYCSNNYTNCIGDAKGIMDDSSLLNNVNNFVHPFNTYKTIKITYTNAGRITITVNKLYSEDEMNVINKKVDELYSSLISSNKSTTENIRSIHDYIINNTIYDSAYITGTSTHKANMAYGALLEGYAVCSGYTDLMSVFLNRMGISNYKVSNDKHVWNLVYLDGKWLHLDLTFDDPIYSDGSNHLLHNYFLISTDRLKQLDQQEGSNDHTFNEKIYLR